MICFRLHAWRAFLGFSLFLILFSSCASEIVVAYTKDEAYGLVQRADQNISSAFEAILDAEAAGANVSGLIMKLNKSLSLLAEADSLLRNGGHREAAELASRLVEMADSVRNEASALRNSALSDRDFVFRASLLGSAVGVSVFLVFMFFLWRRFKGYYVRRILGLRPEVATDVEP